MMKLNAGTTNEGRMMDKHIEELKKAASAIGYEKWITDGCGEVATADYVGEDGVITGDHICNCEVVSGESENATFIALANPARILDLLAKQEAAEKEIHGLKMNLSDAGCLLVEWKQRVEKADKERDELEMSLNVANDATCIWKGRAEAAEARLLVPVKLPTEEFNIYYGDFKDRGYIKEAVIRVIHDAGFLVEGDKR